MTVDYKKYLASNKERDGASILGWKHSQGSHPKCKTLSESGRLDHSEKRFDSATPGIIVKEVVHTRPFTEKEVGEPRDQGSTILVSKKRSGTVENKLRNSIVKEDRFEIKKAFCEVNNDCSKRIEHSKALLGSIGLENMNDKDMTTEEIRLKQVNKRLGSQLPLTK